MPHGQVEGFAQIADVPDLELGSENDKFGPVQDFLERFGYLEPGSYREGLLDGTTSVALATYQSRNAVPISGELDQGTREAMTTSRCALPDLDNGLAFTTACAWSRTNLTFAFGPGTADTASNTEFDAVRTAFGTWASVTPMSFAEVASNQNPDILIDWRGASDPDYNMVGSVHAHADYPPGCDFVTTQLPKPVHFDDSETTWSIGAAVNAIDVESVALHEIGHILGLQHTDVRGAVMFPTITSNFTLRALQPDDVAGIQQLYGRRGITWEDLGGQLTSGPASASWAEGRLDVFARGQNNALWHWWYDRGWAGPEDLGGHLTSDPAAASWANGRLDVFARGQNNALWHWWYDGGWAGPEDLGGVLTSGPGAASWANGRLDVFARGQNNALWHWWYDRGWAGPEDLGGHLTSDPAAASWANGRLDVFARGQNNALWHWWYDRGWAGPENLGGVLTSGPGAASWAEGRLDVFARGQNNALWHWWYDRGWAGPEDLGGQLTSGPVAASWAEGRLDVFARGQNNALWHAWHEGRWA